MSEIQQSARTVVKAYQVKEFGFTDELQREIAAMLFNLAAIHLLAVEGAGELVLTEGIQVDGYVVYGDSKEVKVRRLDS